jgi:Glycosyltransferase like family 2
MTRAARFALWSSAGALVYAQVGYPLLLAALDRVRRRRPDPPPPERGEPTTNEPPLVSLIVAAHREAEVIADRVANARALDWPPERLEVIVACDGSPDDTPARARAAGADQVLELEWGGKVRAQDAAVAVARGDLLAFSDANAVWESGALRALAARFEADPAVGYACGQVRFLSEGGTNQEGLYWRYEMAVRALESRLASVTAGNGAIYAVRPEAYVRVDPVMGHDLTLPFTLVKRGWRAVYEPQARASEKMVPTIEGEFRRKRRMMSHAWAIILRGGLLSPRGYPPLYALMILSHRVLRYGAPLLHVVALTASLALASPGRRLDRAALAAQMGLLAAAAAGGRIHARPLLVARYYVLTNASIAAGLWDHLRHGTAAGWTPPEGTR